MSQNSLFDDQRREVRAFDFRSIAKSIGEAPNQSPAAHMEFLVTALNRLEETVDLETSALRALDASAVSEFNNRKSQSLLELNRAQRLMHGQPMSQEVRVRLQNLQTKLENNRWLLLLHLEAVREVASIIASAIRDTDSDGTYSQSQWSAAKRA